eukprot:5855990-Amphidinium_carterae.1
MGNHAATGIDRAIQALGKRHQRPMVEISDSEGEGKMQNEPQQFDPQHAYEAFCSVLERLDDEHLTLIRDHCTNLLRLWEQWKGGRQPSWLR